MECVDSIGALRKAVRALRDTGKTVAFVPTMGNLHEGHLALVREAQRHADAVVVSIFVNPLQFGPNEDLDSYPRTAQQDQAALQKERVDLVFMPSVEVMYPRGDKLQTFVEVPCVSDILCGATRPGHFKGVATVVCRLFNLVAPDVAVFGKKDYQQLLVIRLMVADLGMPLKIIGVETVREADGLAMSSRNQYLSDSERKLAPRLYGAMSELREHILMAGRFDAGLVADAREQLEAEFEVDYLSVRRQLDLREPTATDRALVILAAVRLGSARLIDNVELALPESI